MRNSRPGSGPTLLGTLQAGHLRCWRLLILLHFKPDSSEVCPRPTAGTASRAFDWTKLERRRVADRNLPRQVESLTKSRA